MRHEDYVNSLIDTDNLMELRLMAVRATQEFDAHVARVMEDRGLEVHTLSELTGLETDRLQDLLDGDSPLLEEMLLICHALELDVLLDLSFHVYPYRKVETESRNQIYDFGPSIERSSGTSALQPSVHEMHHLERRTVTGVR